MIEGIPLDPHVKTVLFTKEISPNFMDPRVAMSLSRLDYARR